MSVNSRIPLRPSTSPAPASGHPGRPAQYPVRPSSKYDPEMGADPSHEHKFEYQASPLLGSTKGGSRSNWSSLSGYRKLEYSYDFDSQHTSQTQLAPADIDPDAGFAKFYYFVTDISPLTRLFLVILPFLVILWIPGILQLTVDHQSQLLGVPLAWWSAWWTVLWPGWWLSRATSRILPYILRSTVGVIVVESRRYIDWIEVLHGYVAMTIWTAISWITLQFFIVRQQSSSASSTSQSDVSFIAGLWFAFFVCAAILLLEKVLIQWVAGKYHERSYSERIVDQKRAVKVLATLYQHSRNIPGQDDTLEDGKIVDALNAKKITGRAIKGATTAIRSVVFRDALSEIEGTPGIPPDSPEAMIRIILESVQQTQSLARRLFYSFVQPGADALLVDDIAQFFPNTVEASAAFLLMDKDGNGDVNMSEMELACMECHREQLSMEHSMRDLDSAVGRLDNMLMTVYVIAAVLIIAVALQAKLLSVITGVGTLVLGTSWLIGSSLAEVLTSIIFLFFKYPYDVGDRVTMDGLTYTVKEIRLLNTLFLDSNNALVLAPNVVVNQKFVLNLRRSPRMSEPFTFDVAYDTTFVQIEALRKKMLGFLSGECRDFIEAFDVKVVDFPEQTKMTLAVDIKYKSNIQQAALRATRRNKWICALKAALAEVRIYGPMGDPQGIPPTSRHTLVPWDLISDEDRKREGSDEKPPESIEQPLGGWNLTDRNAALVDDSGDVFGESDEFRMANTQHGPSSQSNLRKRPGVPAYTLLPPPPASHNPFQSPEDFEMTPSRSHRFEGPVNGN